VEEDFSVEPTGQAYYWILAVDKTSGKAVILGAFDSEDKANRVGFEKIDGAFEVVSLPTRDSGKATKILKYRRFSQTARLEEAVKRAKHQGNKEEVHERLN
jgi:hypothetical protein